MNQRKRYLITGGAGFIGSNLITRLLSDSNTDSVVCIDNFDPLYPRHIKESNISKHITFPTYSFLETDITNASQITTKLGGKDFDVIIHLAAKAGVRPSILDPEGYFRTNMMGTLTMLEFAKQKGVKKFLFASSSSVYGTNPHVPWREDDLNLQPISPYASSKIAAEKLCQTYSYLYGIDILALRFFTVYGPAQRPDLAIHKFFKLIYENKAIPVFGDGSTRRDYTYIDDIVQGIIKSVSYMGNGFEIFNLGNHTTVSLNELIDAIEQVLHKKVQLQFLPKQTGDVDQTYADIEKAKVNLGYLPATDLIKGLEVFKSYFEACHNGKLGSSRE